MEGHQGGEQHAVYGEQQGWAEQGAGHHYPAPYTYPDTFGWAPPPQPAPPCFSPRGGGGGLASPHTFPTMSVNVSMNMTMHGLTGYEHMQSDQWPPGEHWQKLHITNIKTSTNVYYRCD